MLFKTFLNAFSKEKYGGNIGILGSFFLLNAFLRDFYPLFKAFYREDGKGNVRDNGEFPPKSYPC